MCHLQKEFSGRHRRRCTGGTMSNLVSIKHYYWAPHISSVGVAQWIVRLRGHVEILILTVWTVLAVFQSFLSLFFVSVCLVLHGQIGLKEGFRSLCVLHQSQIGQFRVSESLPITTTVNCYLVSVFKSVPFWAIAACLSNESLDAQDRQSQVG